MNHKVLWTGVVDRFRFVNGKKVPCMARIQLEADCLGLVEALAGRAINSKRKQSCLGGGLLRVRVTRIVDHPQTA